MSAVDPISAFPSQPPPQAMAQAPVQMVDEDDDLLMDYGDDFPSGGNGSVALEPQVQTTNGVVDVDSMMDVETGAAAAEGLAPEKVFLYGLDNLSTDAINFWVAEHATVPLKKIEWIDDSSCCLVFDTSEAASIALRSLEATPSAPHLLRPAKPASQHPDARLQVRVARTTDRKERGARERSRYYLFHPEEDRGDRYERERRPPRDRDYSRRYYDSREHDNRRRRARDEGFNVDMYDDSGPRPARRRSFSPERDRERRRRTRSRSPSELFPGRDGFRPSTGRERNRGVELFPEHKRSRTESPKQKELFPQKTGQRGGAAMDAFKAPAQTVESSGSTSGPKELFPQRVKELFPQKPKPERDLFDRRATEGPGFFSLRAAPQKSLAERITMPARSLADRISLPGESGGGGETGGLKIKGAAAAADRGSDGFADGTFSGRGAEAGSRRRRGGRRSKAEDFLG